MYLLFLGTFGSTTDNENYLPFRFNFSKVVDQFDEGAARLIRLEAGGSRKGTLKIVRDFDDFNTAEGDKFSGKNGEVVSPATWLYAGRDRQFLYCRFLCYEPDMATLRENILENDNDKIWLDDSVEIHLFPDENNLQHGFQIIVNSAGAVYDTSVVKANLGDPRWNSLADVNIVKQTNRWIAEIRLPFAAIGVNDPNFTGTIIANFYRNRTRDGLSETSCWSPTGLDHNVCPEKFGMIDPGKE